MRWDPQLLSISAREGKKQQQKTTTRPPHALAWVNPGFWISSLTVPAGSTRTGARRGTTRTGRNAGKPHPGLLVKLSELTVFSQKTAVRLAFSWDFCFGSRPVPKVLQLRAVWVVLSSVRGSAVCGTRFAGFRVVWYCLSCLADRLSQLSGCPTGQLSACPVLLGELVVFFQS